MSLVKRHFCYRCGRLLNAKEDHSCNCPVRPINARIADVDGFRFAGVDVHFGRTACRIEDVIREVWGAEDDVKLSACVSISSGGGSPYYVREDTSPWQDNAIRALEGD